MVEVNGALGAGLAGRAGARLRAAAPWADRALVLCALAALVAAFAVPRTWARATLSDRGAALLVVTRSGWDLRPTGALVVAVVVLAIVGCGFARRVGHPALGVPLVAAGVAVAALALSRISAADPLEHTIGRLRIGTFQTDEPVTAGAAGEWLWVTVAAGVVMAATALSWLVLARRVAASGAASGVAATAGAAGAVDATRDGAGHGL
ncbi:hypothetical protein [Frankia sp. AgB32]|uniref:hypothetical protein n=1 Tax=Frankia sp. AgB32 TaxID=631119 RepID=UPI00200DAA1C|nr:hypothetical protein [Frankia sp. AgB32]MCK9894559.1 hypothetical protein [Frankia sp. AgB32]